ncbi:sensor histidine kinase [Sphingobacterium sp. 1.A.4]|uniref:sensor histidine kinase n=1 Tax=Sphingobacterium sp. 1.A.4 TaxID=2044603 RepID=UPI001C558B67|nr:HAMP domain-containing sensor histidine kinase [Sphingobacterium sp. 1.A.4]
MKLKHRLSLYSISIFSIVSLLLSVSVYFAYYFQMEKMEEHSLENKTLLAAIYYLEQDELSILEHENIQRQMQRTISRKDIAVFDSLNIKSAGDMVSLTDIQPWFLDQVKSNGKGDFNTESYFYHAIYYHDNEGDFVVLARKAKTEFNEQMHSLLRILLIAFLLGLVIIFFFPRYLGHIAYQPIINIINQIKERDTKNFDQPIKLEKSYSEINDLVDTYNHFVDRIAQTFNVQKNFIDYVSHELRTPITAILGTLEVTNQRDRSTEEYAEAIHQLKMLTNDLQETLEHMMLLSGAKTSFEFKQVRMDEIVWQVIENAILYHKAKITVEMHVQDPNVLQWEGNDKLLALAINNLLENAIKYSDNKPIHVMFRKDEGRLQIWIIDQGIGIPQADLEQVKQNFFRASNTKTYNGKGIGLSMANIIFSLHHIQMQIWSNRIGTQVFLKF